MNNTMHPYQYSDSPPPPRPMPDHAAMASHFQPPTLTITLPHPHKALRPNIAVRMHWGAKANARAKARSEARNATQNALNTANLPPDFTPSGYTLTWYYKGVKPDADNCLAACKGYLDGICDTLGINDRDLDVHGIYRIHSKEQAKTLTLTFR